MRAGRPTRAAPVSMAVQRRLEEQGFRDLRGDALVRLAPWMRWAPAFCAVFMIVGTALASPWLLWGLASTALAGALLPNHPFDYLYNHGARLLTGTPPLPPNTPQRRFACGIATPWLAATGAAFYLDAHLAGYLLGASLAGVAATVAITHFCIPSLIYNALFTSRQSATVA